jgi:hypothetical protein
VIAARALEQFLEELITKTASITTSLQAKTLTPEHIRQHICADTRLSFLHDLANRMATGPHNTARTFSTSSSTSTPTPSAITMNRPSFQPQLSVPYQDPLPSTTSSNQTNLLYINQQLSRSYSNPYYKKVKRNKRSFDLVDQEEDDDDDDDDDNDEPFIPNHAAT